jgi:hypothetical protein
MRKVLELLVPFWVVLLGGLLLLILLVAQSLGIGFGHV